MTESFEKMNFEKKISKTSGRRSTLRSMKIEKKVFFTFNQNRKRIRKSRK